MGQTPQRDKGSEPIELPTLNFHTLSTHPKWLKQTTNSKDGWVSTPALLRAIWSGKNSSLRTGKRPISTSKSPTAVSAVRICTLSAAVG